MAKGEKGLEEALHSPGGVRGNGVRTLFLVDAGRDWTRSSLS